MVPHILNDSLPHFLVLYYTTVQVSCISFAKEKFWRGMDVHRLFKVFVHGSEEKYAPYVHCTQSVGINLQKTKTWLQKKIRNMLLITIMINN